MTNPTSTVPVKAKKRIELLDIFRGFAVFGIFVVNIEIMNCLFINQDAFGAQWTSGIDKMAIRILQLFFYSKFFPIFSFLFGLGISMQALKQMEQNSFSSAFFIRRMAILFLFGLAHILFLWSGDVLHLYALLGLLTSLLIKRSNRFILITAVVLLLFPFYDRLMEFILNISQFNPMERLEAYTSEGIVTTIRNGSYLDGIHLRAIEYLSNVQLLFSHLMPVAFAMFLLGLYFGKNKIIYDINSFIHRIRKPVIIIAILSNVYRLLFLFVLVKNEELRSDETLMVFIYRLMFICDMLMGLFYLWLITWLFRYNFWKKLFNPLKYVGRMALTNYIMHSLIGLILFSSVGFKLYESLSPSETLTIAVATFVFQVIFSKLWLSYFNYGLLEWVWRCFSYKKLLPLKKKTAI
ncbi:DUF418 domain-containing protein [Leptobacterium flavescens]|uniref:DUF418 domain-containing protein n=1 Tax=Leptobacterium flavescens TaxID=472055 RepID=A0A6P0URS5_9FLAO|nr:DUF418 domain-containing protein [Leptobacterium flavescens]NER14678.1 DUF418 domain-containing protein [Leptobacterium flavescens]